MKKNQKHSRKKAITGILVAVAVVLLAGSGVESARAALTYISEYYTAQVEMKDIGVTLVENGEDISYRNYVGRNDEWDEHTGALVQNMLDETDGVLKLGREYKEELTVRNTGTINEYVRVRVYKSWTDADGEKMTELSPDQIMLNFTDNGWILDEDASTAERTVLYYPEILEVDETAPLFADTLEIDEALASKVHVETTTDEDGTIRTKTTYEYNGVTFNLEVEVDAVQTHNAADAIKSAWGVDVNVAEDGSISLAE